MTRLYPNKAETVPHKNLFFYEKLSLKRIEKNISASFLMHPLIMKAGKVTSKKLSNLI